MKWLSGTPLPHSSSLFPLQEEEGLWRRRLLSCYWSVTFSRVACLGATAISLLGPFSCFRGCTGFSVGCDSCRFPELAGVLRKGRACSSQDNLSIQLTCFWLQSPNKQVLRHEAPLLPAQRSVPALAVPLGAESCWRRLATAPAEPSTSPEPGLQLAPGEDAMAPSPLTLLSYCPSH